MASILEMAESHLMNVEREIQKLNDSKTQIDGEIARLTNYLQEGREVIAKEKRSAFGEPEAPSPVFTPQVTG